MVDLQAMADKIRCRIADGIYQPGMPVPGEPRLAVESQMPDCLVCPMGT
ncbi:hypothetical protein [[Actinomadura] parvosata]|nr:hypothetical protein [Nonomuraea sp. ATCC 55076]